MRNVSTAITVLALCISIAAYAQTTKFSYNHNVAGQEGNTSRIPFLTEHHPTTAFFSTPGLSEEWVSRFDVPGNSDDFATAAAVDLDGNIFVTGYRRMLSGSIDYLTVKFDSDGNFLWMRTYDGPGKEDDVARAIAADGWGNAYVTGWSEGDGTDGDIATIRYSAAGTEVWVARYNGPANGFDGAADIAVNGRFRVVVAGISDGGETNLDYVTIRYNKFGDTNWIERWNGPQNSNDIAVDLTMDDACVCASDTTNIIDTQHFFYITGSTKGADIGDDYATIRYQNHDNPSSRFAWAALYDGPARRDDDPVGLALFGGDLYVAGTSTAFVNNLPEFGVGVVKYSLSDGKQAWEERFDNAFARDVTADASGVYVAGQRGSFGAANYFTLKWDPDSTFLWIAAFNGTGNNADRPTAIALNPGGGVYVTGRSVGAGTSEDFATVKYDGQGTEQWVQRFDGPASRRDQPVAILVDRTNHVIVAGIGDAAFNYSNRDYAAIKYNAGGAAQWQSLYDSPGNSNDVATAATRDAEGNIYITGYTETVGTYENYLTAKFSAAGVPQWFATYNGPGDSGDHAVALSVDNTGNVYVTGRSWGDTTRYDYATIKYDATGAEIWVRRYNGTDSNADQPVAIHVDASHVYVTGTSRGQGTREDFATIKYDIDGNETWVARYDNPAFSSAETASALGVDLDGNVFVTGYGPSDLGDQDLDYSTIKYNAGGAEQWVAYYDGTVSGTDQAVALAVDTSGHIIVTGTSTGSFNTLDFTTVKYDADGDTVWTARYDPTQVGFGSREATALAVDQAGNVYVTGTVVFSGQGENFATVKYDASGVEQWVGLYDGPQSGEDRPNAIAVDTLGNVYVTGKTFVEEIEDEDMEGFIDIFDFATIAYDSAGNELWSATYDGPVSNDDAAVAVAVDDSLRVYVSGLSVGDRTQYDFTIVRYRQSPVSTVRENTGEIPGTFQLSQNYPNPFNPSTTIRFSLPQPSRIAIGIYDLLGNEIRVLEDEHFATGTYSVSWNGIDKWGHAVASGVYFVQMRAGVFVAVRKIALIR